eukprot:3443459-Pyramimonas_sp.AAC.1
MQCGLTQVMLKQIKHVVLWWTSSGDPRKIGDERGAQGDVVRRCIARMCAMSKLAILTVETEFPHFDIL